MYMNGFLTKYMKIAIIHDWLTGMRGGEKCLEIFCELFPDAVIFTLLHNKGSVSKRIESMPIRTSFIQHLPKSAAKYRNYLPLFPMAVKGFDLTGFDLILSSSHCVAKGVTVPEKALHICYCYTPMRYAWVFYNEYFGKLNVLCKIIVKQILNWLRQWDLRTNENVDFFVAISDNIKNRIKACYNRPADVIYPPVDTERLSISTKDEDFYLIVSALVPYKRLDIAIEAFNKSGKRLVIIGTGNSEAGLKRAASSNIEFLGWLSNEDIADYYSRCKALIFPGEEDFGIVPVEAQSCGKAVIAYGKGGALETIVPLNPDNTYLTGRQAGQKPTGAFFYEQTSEALIGAIDIFEKNRDKFDPQVIRENGLRFNREIFKEKIRKYIEGKIDEKKK